jgi:dolichol-phosphate mannosyltransferase
MTRLEDHGPDLLRVLVGTATYNESDNITEWLNRTRAAMPDADIIVVDDSSPDGTAAVVQALSSEWTGLHLLLRPAKSGLGSAHRAMMVYALENGYDALFTLDADLSHQPEQLQLLRSALATCDFVIGTRSGRGSSDYSGLRKWLSLGGNLAARTLTPTGLTEYTTSMRGFRPSSLELLLTQGVRDDGYAFFMECVVILARSNCSVAEVPIHFVDRTRGQSKIPKHQIWLSAMTLIRLTVSRRGGVKVRSPQG